MYDITVINEIPTYVSKPWISLSIEIVYVDSINFQYPVSKALY